MITDNNGHGYWVFHHIIVSDSIPRLETYDCAHDWLSWTTSLPRCIRGSMKKQPESLFWWDFHFNFITTDRHPFRFKSPSSASHQPPPPPPNVYFPILLLSICAGIFLTDVLFKTTSIHQLPHPMIPIPSSRYALNLWQKFKCVCLSLLLFK